MSDMIQLVESSADKRVVSVASLSATDEYTRHSVHVTQPYTGTTADSQLTPQQN